MNKLESTIIASLEGMPPELHVKLAVDCLSDCIRRIRDFSEEKFPMREKSPYILRQLELAELYMLAVRHGFARMNETKP